MHTRSFPNWEYQFCPVGFSNKENNNKTNCMDNNRSEYSASALNHRIVASLYYFVCRKVFVVNFLCVYWYSCRRFFLLLFTIGNSPVKHRKTFHHIRCMQMTGNFSIVREHQTSQHYELCIRATAINWFGQSLESLLLFVCFFLSFQKRVFHTQLQLTRYFDWGSH